MHRAWVQETCENSCFFEFTPGFNDGGNETLGVEQGGRVTQYLGDVFLQPQTIYVLQAGVGHRAGITQTGNISRIALNNEWPAPESSSDLDASTLPANSFGQLIHRQTTGAPGDVIGHYLLVELSSPGAGRSYFDNIRLASCQTFTGGDTGEGLDLHGSFVYALNCGSSTGPGLIGDANFTGDNVPGVTFSSSQTASVPALPDLGATASDTRLETLLSSIRESNTQPGNLAITLGGLTPGAPYKLQILVPEMLNRDSGYDVRVDGVLVFDDLRRLDFGPNQTMLLVSHSFLAAGTSALVELDGTTAPGGIPDRRGGLSALTLERSAVVTTVADSGPGSLRQALADAAADPWQDIITFDPAVFNSEPADTIVLSSGIVMDSDVILDGGGLNGGVTIDGGPGGNSIFCVKNWPTVHLKNLTLTGGDGLNENCEWFSSGGAIAVEDGTLSLTQCTLSGNSGAVGGAIYNSRGTLSLTRCILSGNTGERGGAVYSDGLLSLTQCILSGNTAVERGGAIHNNGDLIITQCTLSGNSSQWGGAIYNDDEGQSELSQSTLSGNSAEVGGAIDTEGNLILAHCTLAGNSAEMGGAIRNWGIPPSLIHCTLYGNLAASNGGAIYNQNSDLSLMNCIVAGNTAAEDIFNAGQLYGPATIIRTGANIIQSITNGEYASDTGPAAITADPLLAPLGDYGGPTPTLALRPGSPARNASTGSTATVDQRGYPSAGVPDIGAYEAGNAHLTNYNAYIWETLPATATPAQTAVAMDYDSDGLSNELEWLARTDAADSGSFWHPAASRDAGDLVIEFPSVTGRTYRLQQSETLAAGSWTDTALPVTGDGATHAFRISTGSQARQYFRIKISNP